MNKRVSTDYKTYLSEDELPTHYYNLRADMKTDHAPMLNPKTLKPVTVEDLEPVFATELAKQELNTTDRFIPIPESVRDFYKMYHLLLGTCGIFGESARYSRQDLLQIRRQQYQRFS